MIQEIDPIWTWWEPDDPGEWVMAKLCEHGTPEQIRYGKTLVRLVKWHEIKWFHVRSDATRDTGFDMVLDWTTPDRTLPDSKWCARKLHSEIFQLNNYSSWSEAIDRYLACLAHEVGHIFCITNDQLAELDKGRQHLLDFTYAGAPLMLEMEIEAWQWAHRFLFLIWTLHMQNTMVSCLNSYCEANPDGLVIYNLNETNHG